MSPSFREGLEACGTTFRAASYGLALGLPTRASQTQAASGANFWEIQYIASAVLDRLVHHSHVLNTTSGGDIAT